MTPHEKRVSIFETKDQYLQMKEKWAETKNHSATEHALYNILRGHETERGFTPIQRISRLENGHTSQSFLVESHIRGFFRFASDERLNEFFSCFGEAINPIIARKAHGLLEMVPKAEDG